MCRLRLSSWQAAEEEEEVVVVVVVSAVLKPALHRRHPSR